MNRDQAIADAYAAGENTVAIAARFGITRQRVEQLARVHGLPHRFPARRPKSAAPVRDDRCTLVDGVWLLASGVVA